MVLNVVNFQEKASRLRESAARRSADDAIDVIPGLILRVDDLRQRARAELHDAIRMLDHAVQQAHQLGKIVGDPALKRRIDDELLTIEDLLQLARDKTVAL